MFIEKKKKPRKPCRAVFLLVAALAFASNAYADSCTTAYMPTFTAAQASTLCGRIGGAAPQMKNNTYLKGINTTGTPVALIGLNASNVVAVGAPFQLQNATGTPLTSTDSGGTTTFTNQINSGGSIVFTGTSGNYVRLATYVPTLAATPVAGTNYFAPGLSIIPTNAANNAGFIGANATPVVGEQFRIVNNSGAAQRIKASGGATLNGATAGGYISIASLATVDCIIASATNQVCLQPVIPTPAGP